MKRNVAGEGDFPIGNQLIALRYVGDGISGDGVKTGPDVTFFCAHTSNRTSCDSIAS